MCSLVTKLNQWVLITEKKKKNQWIFFLVFCFSRLTGEDLPLKSLWAGFTFSMYLSWCGNYPHITSDVKSKWFYTVWRFGYYVPQGLSWVLKNPPTLQQMFQQSWIKHLQFTFSYHSLLLCVCHPRTGILQKDYQHPQWKIHSPSMVRNKRVGIIQLTRS
jgi:hypothetical protein